MSEETKQKLSISQKKKYKLHPELKTQISLRNKGMKHTDEARKKISETHKGVPKSDEWKRKISESNKGKHPMSEETRKKISELHKGLTGERNPLFGRKLSEETKQKLSLAHRGKKQTPESNLKRSLALKGIPKSEVHREKHRGKNNHAFGKPQTEEQKERLRKANSGRSLSKEHKEKLKKIGILAWETGKRVLTKEHHTKMIDAARNHCWDESRRIKISETRFGGLWYGNVRYYNSPQYCEKFNNEFKERVRAYWNYKCVECGEQQTKPKLLIHHVHYDKKMCCNGSPQDVVPLCRSCHSITNGNRDYWEDHFTEMIYNLDPNGKCFFTKEEMKLLNV